MMKRPIWIALLFLMALVAATPLCAQQTAQKSAPVAPRAGKKALFWKVTSGAHVAYLLGSIHAGSKDMYPLPKEMEDAFDSSTALIVEVDENHIDQQKIQGVILQTGMYTGDDTLWDHISAENRKRVEALCEKYGFPSVMMAKMKPWVVAMMVATLPALKNGMDVGLGIDKHFMDEAGKSGKQVVELESADWQLKLLSGITDKILEQFLEASADEDPLEEAKKMEQAWRSGNAELMDQYVRESMTKGPQQLSKALLTDRNPHMADVAEQYLKGKEQGFIVVGAAHMVGRDGIVALLRKRGYKVEQVALAE